MIVLKEPSRLSASFTANPSPSWLSQVGFSPIIIVLRKVSSAAQLVKYYKMTCILEKIPSSKEYLKITIAEVNQNLQ